MPQMNEHANKRIPIPTPKLCAFRGHLKSTNLPPDRHAFCSIPDQSPPAVTCILPVTISSVSIS